MRKLFVLMMAAVIAAAFVPPARAEETTTTAGTVFVRVSETEVTVGNALVERTWTRDGWSTTSFLDKRTGIRADAAPDFTLDVGPTGVASDVFNATDVTVDEIPGGLRVTALLALADGTEPALSATRVIEIYEDIAGMRTQTILTPLSPLILRGYTIEQAAVGEEVAPTIHAFRAGADWREPDWPGAQLAIGDKHAGTWRDTRSAEPGEALRGPAQWISTGRDGNSLFMVMERNDWPSSRAGYGDGIARLNVDYSADIVITGPFEEQIHVENPQAGTAPGRHRVLPPATSHELEAAFVGFGTHADDEPWQFYKYLSEHRLDPYDTEVTFNSNGTDADVRSDGAKDDMVEEVIVETAPIAKRLGIDTFILDDGWQARSGDWEPDCGDTPGSPNTDPRWDGTDATAKFRPRYSDCTFQAVRNAIAPMELGLWMSAMHFHPRSSTYMSQPHWACKPVGDATGALSILEPSGGSNDAGIGTWSAMPEVIGHVESRIQNAIDNWGVTYFKFDFLVWLDCAGQNDLYEYKEAFIAMLDRLIARNPSVTFQIDETNDYRLFPFESVTRGPSWFQNGSPSPDRLLHNLWNLSPYVPAYSLGQHFLGGNQYRDFPVDTLMAISLPGHLTFFSDLRHIPLDVVDRARPWLDFYKANRDHFRQMTYPLLADPLEKSWTALQTWNPEAGKGALLAFRQQGEDASRTIALRNVPEGMLFDLFEAPTGEKVRTVTSAQLRDGLKVTIPEMNGARVLLIQQHGHPTENGATITVAP
ncbi:MAG: alpha-galactosidase [Actinomycetota bacterium]